MTPLEILEEWARQGETAAPTPWDRMPEIYLYMDQVITYMHSQLSLFERTEENPLLTSSMINNYVKSGVLERPEKKKYSRSHLAMLMVICMLKQVLSLQDISSLIRPSLEAGGDHYAHRSADRSVDGCLPDENAVLEPESTRNQFCQT